MWTACTLEHKPLFSHEPDFLQRPQPGLTSLSGLVQFCLRRRCDAHLKPWVWTESTAKANTTCGTFGQLWRCFSIIRDEDGTGNFFFSFFLYSAFKQYICSKSVYCLSSVLYDLQGEFKVLSRGLGGFYWIWRTHTHTKACGFLPNADFSLIFLQKGSEKSRYDKNITQKKKASLNKNRCWELRKDAIDAQGFLKQIKKLSLWLCITMNSSTSHPEVFYSSHSAAICLRYRMTQYLFVHL